MTDSTPKHRNPYLIAIAGLIVGSLITLAVVFCLPRKVIVQFGTEQTNMELDEFADQMGAIADILED